ncbi:Protein-tyrosine phosphatase, receptor/non-receptor type domain and Protein-tyrosine/Dual specificity phosphatase domain and Protein-tyrosine phosphatase, catalytic domain-containing protein [Strongyloides ratti]|uniref:Protein-tyrosine phosphatase, receptor/non-receptor type domain and Protein-tyrosine/Dual specificity phosphatase domain and Protein-tyrosine phosphatase, catalytic domain-containing protein n=1 Tax=Strongyloides ratti TaxID=34506 RepID=A0A090MXM5_STRRB|nr:Protein-tyrosine phosphatase, receptor/non-receptor type domain and Protein-tyrosine/Dual specificity phosphatase domain and Protein-tyrosine phosphatase, catalytic domain-containing protein [Strongyloides ratti]CEF65694.1 Protein-tyrosine phosphatase, receptor/non-receptor type domain and Protein-tyrosine/Dual specificity phosphatase domain and Protein-tyrosine phosphatase, catalytic domain-containing protein [Strongyloides ratti]
MDCKELETSTNENGKQDSQLTEIPSSDKIQEQDVVPRKIPCLNSELTNDIKIAVPESSSNIYSQTTNEVNDIDTKTEIDKVLDCENNADSTISSDVLGSVSTEATKQINGNVGWSEVCEKLAKDIVDKGVDEILEEFYSLNYGIEDVDLELFFNFVNMSRNRYRDIVLKDATRIILEDEENDYIHANYVSTPSNNKRFICCQAPLEQTTEHFWKMVLQEESEYIFMLCHIVEEGREKCHPYYPGEVGQKLVINKLTIENSGLEEHPTEYGLRVCVLKIYEDDLLKKTVKHWQYVSWPDRKVPLLSETIFYALDNMRISEKPIIVHCSAGIGRTGTVVFLENLLEKINNGDIMKETPANVLEAIRKQRVMSVQTPMQYLYTHRLLLNHLLKEGKIRESPELQKFFREYDEKYDQHN